MLANCIHLTDFAEDFKIFFKYFAFIGCAGKAPIRQNVLDKTDQLVSIAGAFENIRRWYVWTPTQLSIMDQAENLSRVLITGGNGTGKSTILETVARQIAEKGKGMSNVIYVIMTKYPNLLFRLQMEVHFAKHKNVLVKVEPTINSIVDLLGHVPPNSHIFIDELSIPGSQDCSDFNELSNLRAKSVWAVIRATNPESLNAFKDWHKVHLKYPLRTTKTISEYVKEIPTGLELHGLGNDFNASLNIDANMPLGPKPKIYGEEEGTYAKRLMMVLNDFQKPAFIILNVLDMKPTRDEIYHTKKFTPYTNLITNRLFACTKGEKLAIGIDAVDKAVKACHRSVPLLWFSEEYNEAIFQSDHAQIAAENAVKKYIREGNKLGEDIVTDNDCVAGYEANFVILLGESPGSSPWSQHAAQLTMGRCSGQFVLIP